MTFILAIGSLLAAQANVVPPGTVSDMEVIAVNGGSVTLRWTKPAAGDFPLNGFDLKLSDIRDIDSEQAWDDADWAGYTMLSAWTDEETLVSVTGNNSLPDSPPLEAGRSYWFSVRYFDWYGYRADLSNSATTAPPVISPTPAPPVESGSTRSGGADGGGCGGSARAGLPAAAVLVLAIAALGSARRE